MPAQRGGSLDIRRRPSSLSLLQAELEKRRSCPWEGDPGKERAGKAHMKKMVGLLLPSASPLALRRSVRGRCQPLCLKEEEAL